MRGVTHNRAAVERHRPTMNEPTDQQPDAPAPVEALPGAPVEPATLAPVETGASTQGVAIAAASAPPVAGAPPDMSPAACGARLAELFPALFAVPGAQGPVKPIKLRIQLDIQQRAPGVFTKRVLGIFFSRYTTSNAYLKALVNAPQRFDLDGQPAGEISDEHRRMAAEELARRRDVHLARRNVERDAQRETQRAQEAAARQAHAAEDHARRDRATLLRAFETTTLTPANFCALKGLALAALEAQLAQARQERADRPPEPERMHAPQAQRPEWPEWREQREPRRDDRQARPDARRGGPPKPQR